MENSLSNRIKIEVLFFHCLGDVQIDEINVTE